MFTLSSCLAEETHEFIDVFSNIFWQEGRFFCTAKPPFNYCSYVTLEKTFFKEIARLFTAVKINKGKGYQIRKHAFAFVFSPTLLKTSSLPTRATFWSVGNAILVNNQQNLYLAQIMDFSCR